MTPVQIVFWKAQCIETSQQLLLHEPEPSWMEDLGLCFMGLQGFHSLAATCTPGRHPGDPGRQQSKRGWFRINNNSEGGARRRLGVKQMLRPSNAPWILKHFLLVGCFNIHRFCIRLLLSNAPKLGRCAAGRICESLIGGRRVNISLPRLGNESQWIGHPRGRRPERVSGLKHVS